MPASRRRDVAIEKATLGLEQLRSRPPHDMTALRLVEATCASAYFAAWRGVDMQWKATARRPVPDDWRAFSSRTSIANGAQAQERQRVAPAERDAELRLRRAAKPATGPRRGGRVRSDAGHHAPRTAGRACVCVRSYGAGAAQGRRGDSRRLWPSTRSAARTLRSPRMGFVGCRRSWRGGCARQRLVALQSDISFPTNEEIPIGPTWSADVSGP